MTRLCAGIFLIFLALVYAASSQAQSLGECVNVTQPQYKYGTVGRHIVLVCTNATRTILYQDGISCLHSTCSIDKFSAAMARIIDSPTPRKAVDAEMAVVKWDCSSPPGVKEQKLCDERMTWVRANWPVWTKDFQLKGQ